jgi:hypothetical protein
LFFQEAQDSTDPYPTPQAIFDRAKNLSPYERFPDIFKRDLIVAAGCVAKRKLRRIQVEPYVGALIKRGLMKGEAWENISPEVEEGMMFSTVIGIELVEGLADLGDTIDGVSKEVEVTKANTTRNVGSINRRVAEVDVRVVALEEHRDHVQMVEVANMGWKASFDTLLDQTAHVLRGHQGEIDDMKVVMELQ